jgi:hypothetical protein
MEFKLQLAALRECGKRIPEPSTLECELRTLMQAEACRPRHGLIKRQATNMDEGRYIWRKLNDKQRQELLNWRRKRGHPWHSPPHRSSNHFHYHVSAACYEHRHYIGSSLKRMEAFSVQCERLRRMTRRNMWSHGASCQIITTSFWPHRTFLDSWSDSGRCMGGLRSIGMERKSRGDERCGTTPSSVRCAVNDTFGRQ